jgi:two-component system, OmpR family, sensor histidine kinase SenX3
LVNIINTVTWIVAGLVGLVIGVGGTLLVRHRLHAQRPEPVEEPLAASVTPEQVPAEVMLELLPTAAVLLDTEDVVRLANTTAWQLGIVRDSALDVPELSRLVQAARRTGQAQTAELALDFNDFPRRALSVGARAQPLDGGEVALVVDDLTEAKRVESVRRDFVANVGHEIKTPVGALQLLAEAAIDAHDDPVAVERFVGRMQHEAQRLARLVQELLDLSRLQGGEPLPAPTEVSVDAVLDEAVDRARLVAETRGIVIVRGGDPGLVVRGEEGQLVTAVANLLYNAVSYSPDGTRVALGVRLRDDVVEITVTDQGVGIPEDEQERIFERFYRVDPARSRATGGTGLGLAIVKHTVGNHGGEVTVWSQPGNGSTFTIRLVSGSLPEVGAPALLQEARTT